LQNTQLQAVGQMKSLNYASSNARQAKKNNDDVELSQARVRTMVHVVASSDHVIQVVPQSNADRGEGDLHKGKISSARNPCLSVRCDVGAYQHITTRPESHLESDV
jgi:hypothetical protein